MLVVVNLLKGRSQFVASKNQTIVLRGVPLSLWLTGASVTVYSTERQKKAQYCTRTVLAGTVP